MVVNFLCVLQGESTDNFNWGVRRRPLSDGETEREPSLRQLEESLSEKTPVLGKRKVCSRSKVIKFLFMKYYCCSRSEHHILTELNKCL
jgi:hypothetical protein